jgi:ChrR Cupin-like domain
MNSGYTGFSPDDEIVPQALMAPLLDAVRDVGPIEPVDNAVMKSRLLARVREARESGHTTTIHAGEEGWERFGPRVKIKVLRREADTMSYLLKLDPGAMVVPHRHRIDEECVVLEGEVIISGERVRAGAYHLAPHGVDHVPIRTETGAVLFLRGAPPSFRDISKWETIKASMNRA